MLQYKQLKNKVPELIIYFIFIDPILRSTLPISPVGLLYGN